MDDEQRLIGLLAQRRELTDSGEPTGEIDREIIAIADPVIRREVLPRFSAVRRGTTPVQTGGNLEHSFRPSELANEFFARVLQRGPAHDPFWKASTSRELILWTSKVIGRMIVDRFRKATQRSELSREDGHLAEFVRRRQARLATECPDLLLVDVAPILNEWTAKGGRPAQRALVFELRFVGGYYDRSEAAAVMQIPLELHDELLREAKEYLRRRLGGGKS